MSSERAIQLHSLIINDEIDTWDDWKIVSVKKPVFSEPELRSEYVEVPGRDGALDMTEALTGYPVFENRTGTLQFFLYDDSIKALTKLNVIRNYLHGRKHKIILNDEPDYYYVGRLMMKDSHPTKEGEYAVFEIEYNLEPYKYEINTSAEDWLWDPFNFETGVIREYSDIEVAWGLTTTVTVVGSRKPTPLRLIMSVEPEGEQETIDAFLHYEDVYYSISLGLNIYPQIMLVDGEYALNFQLADSSTINKVSISIDYRGGCL